MYFYALLLVFTVAASAQAQETQAPENTSEQAETKDKDGDGKVDKWYAEPPPPTAEEIANWRKVGIKYFHGDERYYRRNYAEAFKFFEKAAGEADPTALYYLGTMYDEGLGVDQDEYKGYLYYKRAGELGHPEAQMVTGVLTIMKGMINKNREKQEKIYTEGVEWLEKAYAQGNMEAAFWLGDMTRKGLGTEKDTKKGEALLEESAESGNPNAEAMVGAFYWKGVSNYEIDLMKAHKLMSHAARGGNPQARMLLIKLERDMPPEQLKEAERLARIASKKDDRPKKANPHMRLFER